MTSTPSKVLIKKRLVEGGRLKGAAAFGAIWLGQMFSMFGAHLASFALGVWVYQSTRSVTDFSLIAFFAILPEIALSPIAGIIVDRFDRRLVMLAGSTGAGLCGAALAALAIAGQLQVWHIYIAVAASSAFQSVEFPALSASITMLVPQRHLSRANGMVELNASLAMVVAPLVAGILLDSVGLNWLLLTNVVTFAIAIASLLIVRIGRPEQAAESETERCSLLREATFGWRYIKERPELMALLILFASTNFSIGIVEVLLPPLVLSFASESVLGMVLAVGGVGLVLSSVLVSLWGGPRKKIRVILGLAFAQGAILFLGVMEARAMLIGTAAFVYLFCSPIIVTCSQTIWQTKVAAAVQGRTFAIRRVVASSFMPLAYLAAGPLADRVFEPMMSPDGSLAPTAGAIIGTGPGRGIALLFIIVGFLTVMTVTIGFLYRPLRDLEIRLPDAA